MRLKVCVERGGRGFLRAEISGLQIRTTSRPGRAGGAGEWRRGADARTGTVARRATRTKEENGGEEERQTDVAQLHETTTRTLGWRRN